MVSRNIIALVGAGSLAHGVVGAQCKYPGGECYELAMQKCNGNKTATLHGLWPEWGNYCKAGEDFNLDTLAPIIDEMRIKWASCPEYHNSDTEFWTHEWNKHGKCSGMGLLDFFKKTLALYDQYGSNCTKDCKVCFAKDLTTTESCSNPPKSLCKYPGGECYELAMQRCKEGDTKGTMTLHGLWAEWSNECKGASFDYDLLSPIMPELLKKWISCPEDGGDNKRFWAHEWQKHGTCSGMDQLTFFNKTLALFDAHNGECGSGNSCSICFSKDFTTEEKCSDEADIIV